MASTEISSSFRRRYRGRRGLIRGEVQNPELVLVTTTSALGRSSQYNRLKLDGILRFSNLGTTSGWGHFHIPDELFQDMRSLLARREHGYASGYRFGSGPNWRMRVVREALEILDLDPSVLRHGIRREVFALPLAENWREYLGGRDAHPKMATSSAAEIAQAAVQRWIVPRSERRPEFRQWTLDDTQERLEQHLRGC